MVRLKKYLLVSIYCLACACGPLSPLQEEESRPNFASGEHKLIGDRAYEEACERTAHCPERLWRADRSVAFSYGELVAFSGDFYAQPEQIYFEEKPSGLTLPFRPQIDKVKATMDEELAFISEQLNSSEYLSYPDHSIGFVLAFPRYLELSLNNIDHFGWHNMKAYVRYHEQALDLAVEAGRKLSDDPARSQQLLEQALFLNGFADHFLSDAFATGHIRNPRADTMAWGQRAGHPFLAVQALAKLLHDQDHLLSEAKVHDGLPVINSRGDQWQTRCDGQLFLLSDGNDRHIEIPREALTLSIAEVLEAYESGEKPRGTFAASRLVPFLSDLAPDLHSYFHPDVSSEQIESWLDSLGIVSRLNWLTGLDAELARAYFQALPEIMDDFRQRVRRESLDPHLLLRLPRSYRDAFQTIR